MADWSELRARARSHPASIRFDEVCALAEHHGFALVRQRGSHRMYRRPGFRRLLNFQPKGAGMAKAYQVRQLLLALEELAPGHEG